MRFTIQVLIESPGALPLSVPIQTVDRPCERVEDVGLRLEEAKAVLQGLQEQLIRQQLAEYLEARRPCPDCRQLRTIKGYHRRRFRSAFGDLSLRSPRWCRCECAKPSGPASFSALNSILTTHTAPELEMLQAKWAAHVSFAAVADLLHDVLPVDSCINRETIRAHVFETAERLEAELGPEQFAYDAGCQNEIEASPEPGGPVTVGLDGGYIRGRERRPGGTGCFEVIAGKSIPQEGPAKLFAGVGRIDTKPKRRLHEVLHSQGVLPRQQVIFISDGGDTVRELPAFLHPHSEHILDWFHIAMRIEQLMQTARGFRGAADDELTKEAMLRDLARTKWYLWHGNVFRADETLTDLMFEIDGAIQEDQQARRSASIILKKLARALEEFATYVDNNACGIVNYGERHRCGERISTGFVESTINQLVAKRFVKKQQMRWTPRGAHLLLQIRVQALNGDLHGVFERWYPGLGRKDSQPLAA
jgi:hypothetical protein